MEVLDRVLGQLTNIKTSNKILVDQSTRDDAAVYKISEDRAIIFTTDFFSPMVDDPYIFGPISASNAISDIYAMGGTPFMALNICCFSDNLPEGTIENILKGGINKANEAGTIISGGHTINDSEPKYGLAVIGEIHPNKLMTLSNAKEGQDIIITKPIGNGIISTAAKNENIEKKFLDESIAYMLELNKSASKIAIKYDVKSCTDITGYGLIGHLKNLLNSSLLSCDLNFSEIPILSGAKQLSNESHWSSGAKNNEKTLNNKIIWDKKITLEEKMILFDPQTSGGLLFTIDKNKSQDFIMELSENKNLYVNKIGYTIKRTNYQIKFV
ncbi:MAG: selenide, water dikinase SelD [Dehalococcoidales bacterium]|nr:selenide, water dikinase SelD [Dehalococcoidales bacterium]